MENHKNIEKTKVLHKHKTIATGLFLLMVVIYFICVFTEKYNDFLWLGYVKAFSEAAMVGALADWFAVTALFHYPMGIKIPHTNLIENSKYKIGENLGGFVVDNFLNAATIRPYIQKLHVTNYVLEWFSKSANLQLINREAVLFLKRILLSIDDETIQKYIDKKLIEIINQYPVHGLITSGVRMMMEKGDADKIITYIILNTKNYIQEHADLIKERVKKESHFLVPGFVDNIIAQKIVAGIHTFLAEMEKDEKHTIRMEIYQKINTWLNTIESDEDWQLKLQTIKNNMLQTFNTHEYATTIWQNIKNTTLENIENENASLHHYTRQMIKDAIIGIKKDIEFQNKLNTWIRFVVYKYSLRNTDKIAQLITTTVGNWEGSSLSKKMELEVGKDLQFIRINGTIVGGLVGLIIYIITKFIQ